MDESPPLHERPTPSDGDSTASPSPARKPAASVPKSTPLSRQLLAGVVVLVVAVYAWAWFFPGATDLLSRSGLVLPFMPAASTPEQVAGGPPRGPGGPGAGFPRGPGGRTAAVVVTAAVTSAVINDRLLAIGEGSAARSATLTSPAGGTLTELSVAPGDRVEAGTVIAQLDADSQQIAYDRARLAAEDATATLARSTELAGSNAISTVQLTQAQLAADTAALELRNAELALRSRSIITPIAGTVGLLQITPGNAVSAQTVVTTIEDSSEILINFWVPERYASAIAVGMPVTAAAVALPGQTIEGVVSAVDNRIDPQSRTLQVQALIPNGDGRIRPGMSFQITMSFPGETFASVDPLSIQWSAEGAFVWKYVDGKVEQAYVEIVERNSGGVLVTGDVAVGDQVVTQGVLQLQPGSEVRLLDDGAAPEGRRPAGAEQGTPL